MDITVNEIQIKRALTENNLPSTALEGEPIVTLDNKNLYIGMGEALPLKKIETDKTIVFVLSGSINVGPNAIEIMFPYTGTLKSISISCATSTSDLIVMPEKISHDDYNNSGTWNSLLVDNVVLVSGQKSNIVDVTNSNITINKNDHLRINIINSILGTKNATIELLVNV